MVVYLYRINNKINVLVVLGEDHILYRQTTVTLIKKRISKKMLGMGSYYKRQIDNVKKSLNLRGEITDWDDFLYRHLKNIYMNTNVKLLYKYKL